MMLLGVTPFRTAVQVLSVFFLMCFQRLVTFCGTATALSLPSYNFHIIVFVLRNKKTSDFLKTWILSGSLKNVYRPLFKKNVIFSLYIFSNSSQPEPYILCFVFSHTHPYKMNRRNYLFANEQDERQGGLEMKSPHPMNCQFVGKNDDNNNNNNTHRKKRGRRVTGIF